MKSTISITDKLASYFASYFKDKKYFICIYGSYANGHANQKSDVDMFVASTDFGTEDLKNIKKFVIDFHKQNHLSLDNEVPYNVKLLATHDDIRNAIDLKCFTANKYGQIAIPKVEKTRKFLESYDVKLRLILNAFTSPHIFLGNDRESYLNYKIKAEKAIYKLAKNLLHKNKDITSKNLVNVLLNGPNNEIGELYLGYKNYKVVKDYLAHIINKQFK